MTGLRRGNHPFDTGRQVLVRTGTLHTRGEIERREGDWLFLKNASWIADGGRSHRARGPVAVNLAAAADVVEVEVQRDEALMQERESRGQIGDRYLEAVEALKAAEADAARLAQALAFYAEGIGPESEDQVARAALAAHREREKGR